MEAGLDGDIRKERGTLSVYLRIPKKKIIYKGRKHLTLARKGDFVDLFGRIIDRMKFEGGGGETAFDRTQ